MNVLKVNLKPPLFYPSVFFNLLFSLPFPNPVVFAVDSYIPFPLCFLSLHLSPPFNFNLVFNQCCWGPFYTKCIHFNSSGDELWKVYTHVDPPSQWRYRTFPSSQKGQYVLFSSGIFFFLSIMFLGLSMLCVHRSLVLYIAMQ